MAKAKVIMYATGVCPYCTMAERLLYPAYVERPALVPPQLRDEI